MSSQQRHQYGAGSIPAPDDSDFLDSDDERLNGQGHALTELEAELATVATPATSQTTTATASARRRQRLTPVSPLMQMTHNFSFAVFDTPLPNPDVLNRNGGREAAGLPVEHASSSQSRHGRSHSGLSSTAGSPSRSSQQRNRGLHGGQGESDGPASSIAPHLAADATVHWFSVDTELVYLSFFDDWGPLNVAMFYRFCLHLHHLINSAQDDAAAASGQGEASSSNLHLVLYTTTEPRLKANAALLAAMYAMVCSDASPADAYWPLSNLELLPFRDAGYGRADYYLTVQDILCGVHRAMSEQLLDLMTFDLEEYETYEQVQNGDWNWITPNIIAFASPNDKEYVNELRERAANQGRATPGLRRPLNPTFTRTVRYFKERNVKLVVRLNNPLYDSRVFEREGINHVDMYFDDGSNPSEDIVRNFITKADKVISDGGVIAVHCKAGLGRTGVLIGAYLAYRHGFSAGEAIGFMRIMRPGCVVGPQQHFMYKEMPTWIRWREQDEASKRIEQALAKQKLELIGKRRLSESQESSSNDTEAEVDISLGESDSRQSKRMRRSSHGPSTPKRDDAYVHIAKPTPCVGQPRKSPSPSRKRMAQAAQAPATVGRIGSGNFTLNMSRVVSGETSRSSGPVTRRKSATLQQEDKGEGSGAAASLSSEIVDMPSEGSRVLANSPRVHDVEPSEAQAFADVVEGSLEAAARPKPITAPKQNDDSERRRAAASPSAHAHDEELFVQGWKSPDPPSSLIKQQLSSQVHAPGTPTGTPTRASVGRASPHVREMFGLRDSSSDSGQGTSCSRKEGFIAAASSNSEERLDDLQHASASASTGSLADRRAVDIEDDAHVLKPGPIGRARSNDRVDSKATHAKTDAHASPAKGRTVSSSQRANRAPSAQGHTKSNTAQPSRPPVTRKTSANRERPGSAASHAAPAGRVAAARERLAQRENASGAANTEDRQGLKRTRAPEGDRITTTERAASAPTVKRVISSSSRAAISAASSKTSVATIPRAALAPASSVTTNAPTRSRPESAAGHHVPRFAMGTAASAAKSVATTAAKYAQLATKATSHVMTTPAAPPSQSASVARSLAAHQGSSHTTTSSTTHGRLYNRNVHRRRSSLGETDLAI